MEVVVLHGAESVERAGHSMSAAAADMIRAAAAMAESMETMRRVQQEMDFSFTNHQRFLNEWLHRLEDTILSCLPSEAPVRVCIVPSEDEEDRAGMKTMPAPGPDYEGPTD